MLTFLGFYLLYLRNWGISIFTKSTGVVNIIYPFSFVVSLEPLMIKFSSVRFKWIYQLFVWFWLQFTFALKVVVAKTFVMNIWQGMYMVTYQQNFANMLYNSVVMQTVLIWGTSLFMGGYPAGASLALSCLSILLMWIFSLSFSVIAAFVLSLVSPSPVPYVATPWLVVGLFAAPALLGALTGQHFGFLILQTYLSNIYSKKKQLSTVVKDYLIKLEAERWHYKAGFIQWLLILVIGNYYRIGSSYLALVWLVPPAFACKWPYIGIREIQNCVYYLAKPFVC